ncbi:MAG: DUF835 domain-containing protein [Candidatus Thermoplasmatota archaeon]|nr:DUF835 domain-containing protein [Candidatus Thermoplasmatota archaeon]
MGNGPEESQDELDDDLLNLEDELAETEEELGTEDLDLGEEDLEDDPLELQTDQQEEDEGLDGSIAELEEELELEEEAGEKNEESPLDDTIADLEEDLELEEETEESLIFECPVCGENVAQEANECPSCGAVFEEEEGEIEERYESSMEEAKRKLSDFEKEPVPEDHLENLIEDARSSANSSRYDEAIEKVEKALEFGDKLEEFGTKLEEVEKKINDKRGSKDETLEKKIVNAKESIKEGKVDKGFSLLDEAIRKIERRGREEKEGIKKRINQAVQDLNDLLGLAKKFDISLTDIRSSISTSLELSKEGKVNQALEELEQARERARGILKDEIDGNISEIEKKKESIFDDKRRKKIRERIKEADKAKEENRFKDAHEALIQCEQMTAESELKIGNMSVNEIIKIKELAEKIGIDSSDAGKLIDRAKEEHRKGNERRSKKNLKKAKEKLLRRVSKELQKIMKEGMKELEKAKNRGEEISTPVSYLKQANLMIKKGNFIDALEHAERFTSSLERLSEEDMASPTVTKVKKKSVQDVEKKDTSQRYGEGRTSRSSRERSEDVGGGGSGGSKREEREKKFEPDEFYKGSTNLIKTRDLNKAYSLFKELVKDGGVGVCVTRDYPEKAKKKYDLENILTDESTGRTADSKTEVSMIWLSNVDRGEAVKPKNLEKLSLKLESFITDEGGVILLNGIEFLATNNNFKTVLHLIQSLKDQVAMGGSILLITASPDAFAGSQLEQLEREVDESFP